MTSMSTTPQLVKNINNLETIRKNLTCKSIINQLDLVHFSVFGLRAA